MDEKDVHLTNLDGILKAEVSGFGSFAYEIPRHLVNYCDVLPDYRGIYFLYSYENTRDTDAIYVGVASTRKMLSRLQEHLTDSTRDWTSCIAFFSSKFTSDEHIKYLGNKMFKQIMWAGEYHTLNTMVPDPSHGLIRSDMDMLDRIAKEIMLLSKKFGCDAFRDLSDHDRSSAEYHLYWNDIDAYGRNVENGFEVLKGSHVSYKVMSKPSPCVELRRKLERKEIIKNHTFTCDHIFADIEEAGAVVEGTDVMCPAPEPQWTKTPDG
ncbi:MAG: hypothetical protein LBV63_00200 [Candidatus Methanoplasma sp.]|jgi:hypothetical protein|nr:hypothetical protein [Candidatus Methanoplasma sp.]